MPKRPEIPVCLELTEVQKLRLQLRQRECDLNSALRWHRQAAIHMFEAWRLVMELQFPDRIEDHKADVARIGSEMREGLAELERDGERLEREFFAAGEAIKKENNWPGRVRWDTSTLTFSPAQPGESQFVQ